MIKNERGITLIALIITVIILLILAGITINSVVGDNGIINKAKDAASKTNQAVINEEESIQEIERQINKEENDELVHSGIIPEGAKYTTTNGEIYEAGDEFPSINNGDIYTYGDYEYRYNMGWYIGPRDWVSYPNQNGWGVRVVDLNKTSYGKLLININGSSVNTANFTFFACQSMITAPTIPENITSMDSTFMGCYSLRGNIYINTNPEVYSSCFNQSAKSFSKRIHLTGTSTTETKILLKSTGFDVGRYITYDGYVETIPAGATYYSAKTGETLSEGNQYPEVTSGDIFTYGDYEYRYNMGWHIGPRDWVSYPNQNGWGVRVIDKTKSSYGAVLSGVNGKVVNTMMHTYFECTSLVTAPIIPDTANDIQYLFGGCTALKGNVTIDANPTVYTGCFTGTAQDSTHSIVIKGVASTETKNNLKSTGYNNGQYITVN